MRAITGAQQKRSHRLFEPQLILLQSITPVTTGRVAVVDRTHFQPSRSNNWQTTNTFTSDEAPQNSIYTSYSARASLAYRFNWESHDRSFSQDSLEFLHLPRPDIS